MCEENRYSILYRLQDVRGAETIPPRSIDLRAISSTLVSNQALRDRSSKTVNRTDVSPSGELIFK